MSTHRHNWAPRGPYDAGDIRHCTACGRRQQRSQFTPGADAAGRSRELRWKDLPPVPAAQRLMLADYGRLSQRIAAQVDIPEGQIPALDRDRARFVRLLDQIPSGA